MTNEEKAKEIALSTVGERTRNHPSNLPHIIIVKDACIEMARWKDEQVKNHLKRIMDNCSLYDDYEEIEYGIMRALYKDLFNEEP